MSENTRFQLSCNKCNYIWDTKYNRIPAKCPSCGTRIYGTSRYTVLAEYKKTYSSNCFIATAAYGTPFANEINVLRYWRDNSLLQKSLGRKFVSLYYSFSPPIAIKISERNLLKKIIRAFLYPWIAILKIKYR